MGLNFRQLMAGTCNPQGAEAAWVSAGTDRKSAYGSINVYLLFVTAIWAGANFECQDETLFVLFDSGCDSQTFRYLIP